MGKCRSPWRCFPSLKKLLKTSRRSPIFKRALILASACVLYLIFVASHIGNSHDRTRARDDKSEQQRSRGLYLAVGIGNSEALLVPTTAALNVAPTRPNVVYITLRAKRQKPANIRGTIRPKLRRKTKEAHGRLRALESETERDAAAHASWRVNYENVDDLNITSDADSSSIIRIYSQKPPPWLTPKDVLAMRFLAGAKVLRVSKAPPSVVIFEGEVVSDGKGHPKETTWNDSRPTCAGRRSGIVRSPVETTEVFAFHLDRVLGINRTLPAVSRKFVFLHENQPCPVVLWDCSPRSSLQLTWGQYQRSLKLSCWTRNTAPRSDSDCSSIHHHEWSKLALFDFLLQIHRRLDPQCCGFRPRVQDECGSSGCSRLENVELEHLSHREEDPRRLIFTHNRGYFDRSEDSLDFRLLEGIRELPASVVGVLRGGRLRERLLQSLFIDQTYWESQGGRQGIDTLIDVIERRAKVLLTYINAHGIALTPMNS